MRASKPVLFLGFALLLLAGVWVLVPGFGRQGLFPDLGREREEPGPGSNRGGLDSRESATRPRPAPKPCRVAPATPAPTPPAASLCRAARRGDLALVRFLAARGADLGSVGLLSGPLESGSLALYRELVRLGVPVDPADGGSPLFNEENLPLAELLLARGARVNRRNGEGRTPLGLLFRPGRGVLRPGVSARLVALLHRHGGVK